MKNPADLMIRRANRLWPLFNCVDMDRKSFPVRFWSAIPPSKWWDF